MLAKRPVLVWVIVGSYAISLLLGILCCALTYIGKMPASQAYLHSMTWVDYVLTAFIVVANLAANIFLFLLRRPAVYLFITILVLYCGSKLWETVSRGSSVAVSSIEHGGGMIGTFIVILINAGIAYYAWRLMKEGVLR